MPVAEGQPVDRARNNGWRDRASALIHLVIAIVLGARNLSEAEHLGLHHRAVFDTPASDSTLRRMLTALDETALAAAEPETVRFRIYHQSARLASHTRRRTLRLQHTWPWAQAFTTCWQRLTALPTPTLNPRPADR